MNYNLSVEEYIELISQVNYKMKQYEWVGYTEFEKLINYGHGIANMFEELAEIYNRVPTQDEYIIEGLKRSKAYFTDKSKVKNGGRWFPLEKKGDQVTKWHCFKWNSHLRKAVEQRLARSYPSYMVEYSTILTLKADKRYKVGVNNYIDTIMGVDVVAGSKQYNKIAYIHICSSSSYSAYWLSEKENRSGKAFKEDVMYEYTRDFSNGHLYLMFDKEESDTTDIYNGIPFIKEDYIYSELNNIFEDEDEEMDSLIEKNQLKHIHEWLKDNSLNDNGLGSVWV